MTKALGKEEKYVQWNPSKLGPQLTGIPLKPNNWLGPEFSAPIVIV